MAKKICLFILMCAMLTGTSFAKEINIELKLKNKTIYRGKQTELIVIVSGADSIPQPEIPFIDGLHIKHIKTYKEPAMAGSDDIPATSYNYRVAALKSGAFTIGPITIECGGAVYKSNSLVLTVEKEAPGYEAAPGRSEKTFDISKHIYLALDVAKRTVYVNEKVQLKLRLYTDWIDLENIKIMSPTSEYLMIEKFGDKNVKIIEQAEAKLAVLEYGTSVFAATPGQFTINPIRVKMSVAHPRTAKSGEREELLNDNKDLYDSYIGNAQSRALELETQPMTIVVRQFPAADQPAEFSGAVGNYNLDVETGPTKIKMGDTIQLKMSLTGYGNFDTVTIPRIKKTEGLKVYDAITKRGKGSVVYEQIVRVQSPGIKEIPEIVFSYFDPDKNVYKMIRKPPIPIIIEDAINVSEGPGAITEKEKKEKKAPAVIVVGLKESPGLLGEYNTHFYRNKILIFIWLMPIIIIFASDIAAKRLKYLDDNPSYAAMLRASKKAKRAVTEAEGLIKSGNAVGFYAAVFRIMQEYLGTRLMLPSGGVTASILERLSPVCGDETVQRINKLFSECYLVKYTASAFTIDDMKKTMSEVIYVIEDLDKKNLE